MSMNGQAQASTTSLDLPPSLAKMLNMGGSPVAQAPTAGLSAGMGAPAAPTGIPQYQAGGLVGPDGAPVTPPTQPGAMPPATGVGVNPSMQQGAAMDPQMLDMHLNQFATQNPQQMQQIRQAMMEAMQSGELTAQELNMIIQLATVTSQNPDMYPQVRQYAIQQGIATEQDLPPQYDQGLVFVLLLAARAIQQDLGGQDMTGGTPTMASMSGGGAVPKSKKAGGGVIIEAHEDEYVIPANVVKAKGTEFFDSLVAKYAEGGDGGKKSV